MSYLQEAPKLNEFLLFQKDLVTIITNYRTLASPSALSV